MADRRFQDLAQRADFVVKRAASRRLASHRSRDPVHAVVLNGPGIDLGKPHLAEERDEVQPQADTVALDPFGASLAFGDHTIFLLKLLGSLGEGGLRFQDARR
ncbi:hypothetical protein [Rhizobium sp. AG207R]|uniref:hypothetical protein n=1 Tax=Rhizobium sp. AG207R TaxID=2802287 RepID=UPI0022AC40EA|nr:hypothetical protein [Rhizobium sp. AG207R]